MTFGRRLSPQSACFSRKCKKSDEKKKKKSVVSGKAVIDNIKICIYTK